AYANVGFFGIPVTQLAFGPDYLIYQSVLTALMAILVCTVGVWLLAPSGGGKLGKLRNAFETPLIPSVILGLALRGLEVEMPVVISQPLQFLGSIFTPLALYTLGAQVAAARAVKVELGPQTLMLVLKFLASPLLSWWICHAMGLPDDITAVIVVAAATPVGVLITIFAAEYKTAAEFISTAVVISTALSPIFVTGWILATRAFCRAPEGIAARGRFRLGSGGCVRGRGRTDSCRWIFTPGLRRTGVRSLSCWRRLVSRTRFIQSTSGKTSSSTQRS